MPGVLIADDTPLIRAAIARVVARERPQLGPLYEAGCGEEAVEVARAVRPDVVLMDIQMPGVDGIAAGARIRAERPDTKLVFLTAHEEFAYAQQALRIGAVDYLLKPVRPRQLVEALDRVQAQLARSAPQAPAPAAGPESGTARGADRSGGPSRPGQIKPTPLAQALAYMERNLHRPELRLGEVAAASAVSASHLAALIRRQLGRSYHAHLTHLRIERARELLRSTDLTVAAVAAAVGYQTPAPFYQRFKQSVGVTPSAFREQRAAHAV